MIANLVRAAFGSLALFTLTIASAPTAYGSNSCGLIGETCCMGDPQCAPGGICIGNMCTACGGQGEFCCPIGMCDEGLICLIDLQESPSGQGGGAAVGPLLCMPCGGHNQPCCETDCDEGFTCIPCTRESLSGQGSGAGGDPCGLTNRNFCAPCGALNQECCDGECNEGLDCTSAPCDTLDQGSGGQLSHEVCTPCGALGEPCCDDTTCIGDNLLCGSQFCEACGAIGEQCCPDNTCPGSDGICSEGICEALPPAAAMSASGITVLIMTLTAIGLLWMRRGEVSVL